jgi:colicin import membrane protein
VTGAEKLRPTIHMSLSELGALTTAPYVVDPSNQPAMRAMEESALRAVQKCAPLKIPPQFQSFYNEWRDISVTFDIRTML